MKVFTKFYTLFCKADLKGDDDGISQPVSQMKDVHTDESLGSRKLQKKNSKCKKPSAKRISTHFDDKYADDLVYGEILLSKRVIMKSDLMDVFS